MRIKKEDLLRIISKVDETQEVIEIDSVDMSNNPIDGKRIFYFNNLIIKGNHTSNRLVETLEEVLGKKND